MIQNCGRQIFRGGKLEFSLSNAKLVLYELFCGAGCVGAWFVFNEFLREALDALYIPVNCRDGSKKVSPALSIGFMEPRSYVTYKLLPCLVLPDEGTCSEADIEEWRERMAILEEDLTWLLRLSHQRFWCQVTYDENLQLCLQSYLSRAPRDYDLNPSAREDILTHQQNVHRLVFLVFLRMSTYKESKLDHISPHVFGELIYDSYIFDVPRMMDICVLYGFKNQQIISRMIQNLFSTQPSYADDLEECISTMLLAFDNIEEKLHLKGGIEVHEKQPYKLEEPRVSELHSLPLTELLDIINYLTDISATIFCFFDAYPLACNSFFKCGTSTRIPPFYDLVFPLLEEELKFRRKAGVPEKYTSVISKKLIFAKSFLVRAFRCLVTSSCIHPVLNARCDTTEATENSEAFHLENYLQLFTEIATEKVFLSNYNQLFPFSEDLTIFSEAGLNIDVTSLNYILSSVSTSSGKTNQSAKVCSTTNASFLKNESKEVCSSEKYANIQELATSLASTSAEKKNGDADFYGEGATLPKPDDVQIISLIQMVLDVFPDLGGGFLEACLEYYNFDSEKVIDALITDTLPSSLATLDKNMKRKKHIPEESQGPVSLLKERKSIFDYDEFDVFNRDDVDLTKMRKGKSGKTPSEYRDLSTDEDSKILKELTLKFEVELETEKNYNDDPNLYDDEYDDTYDSHPVSLLEPQPENELLRIRPFTTPVALRSIQKKGKINGSENEEDEEEEEDIEEEETIEREQKAGDVFEKIRVPKDEFCVNPADLREQAARQSKLMNRGKPNSDGDIRSKSNPSNFKKKEQHKSHIGNHNRRKQSDFKKSRGMGPYPTR